MMELNNVIIYLIGFAGVGKRTIAGEICAQTNCRLIDNHLINNVVFPFVHESGSKKLPEDIWSKTAAIRQIALDTMIDLGNRDFSYVFTNQLYQDDPDDWKIYHSIETAAEKMGALFIPIRLICDSTENKKRIIAPDRAALYKATSPNIVESRGDDALLHPSHRNKVDIDVTALSAQESSQIILKHIGVLYECG